MLLTNRFVSTSKQLILSYAGQKKSTSSSLFADSREATTSVSMSSTSPLVSTRFFVVTGCPVFQLDVSLFLISLGNTRTLLSKTLSTSLLLSNWKVIKGKTSTYKVCHSFKFFALYKSEYLTSFLEVWCVCTVRHFSMFDHIVRHFSRFDLFVPYVISHFSRFISLYRMSCFEVWSHCTVRHLSRFDLFVP